MTFMYVLLIFNDDVRLFDACASIYTYSFMTVMIMYMIYKIP